MHCCWSNLVSCSIQATWFLTSYLQILNLLNIVEQLLLVQDGKLYGRDPIFSVINKAAALPEATKNHDIQKNEYIVQLGQVMTIIIYAIHFTFLFCYIFIIIFSMNSIFLRWYIHSCISRFWS